MAEAKLLDGEAHVWRSEIAGSTTPDQGAVSTLPGPWLCMHGYAAGEPTGCRTLSGADAGLEKRLRISSGRKLFDDSCAGWHKALTDELAIKAGFAFYDDKDEPNALATPSPLVPGGLDGTVMLGIELLKHESSPVDQFNVGIEMLEQMALPHILVILAHEFAHLYQFKAGMAVNGPWQMEPHADFMAGWLIARILNRSTSSEHGTFVKVMQVMGDRDSGKHTVSTAACGR